MTMQALENRRLLSAIVPGFGLYNPATAQLTLDYNRSGAANVSHTLGSPGSHVVAADFNGDTITDTAAVTGGEWSIDYNNDGTIDKTVKFGKGADLPVAGDITGDGIAALGFYNPKNGMWKFSDNQDGKVSLQYQAQPGGMPLLADWNNSGHDDLILDVAGTWTVTDPNGTLITTFTLGKANQVPIVADLDGTGTPTPGVFTAGGKWKFDVSGDGTLTKIYSNGTSGDEPLVGFFDPSHSIFVSAGATGNGSEGNPLGTISAAIAAAGNGSVIRIAPGDYPENASLALQSNVDFVGAGMDATHIDPASGDALDLVLDANTYVYNINFQSGDRGLVIQGGAVSLYGDSTNGTTNTGLLAVGYQNVNAALTAQNCSFNNNVKGMAVWLQDAASLNATDCTFDGNGTDPSLASSDQSDGIGLQVNGSSTADCAGCDFSNNHAIGVSSFGSTNVKITDSTLSSNFTLDGAIISGDTTGTFRNDTFADNGPVRSPTLGAYGLEITNSFTGPGAIIKNNVFTDNTAAGIFIGNGTGHRIVGNTFNDNELGISINGFVDSAISTIPVNTSATIIRNTFEVTSGEANVTGIFALGGGAGGIVGGSGNDPNLFENFNGVDSPAISLTNYGFSPPQVLGSPTTTILNNNYVNSPNPVLMTIHP